MLPPGADSVGQQGNTVYKRNHPDLVKLDFSPLPTLCVFGQYRINGYLSRYDAVSGKTKTASSMRLSL